MTTPAVAVVVLNYRNAPATIACLDSLKALSPGAHRLIAVDNASGDGSVEAIRHAHPDITLIASPANGGYSAGNNLGIREALTDPAITHVWVLNNDTTVAPDALGVLICQAGKTPRALIGPCIRYPDGRFQTVGNRIDRRRWVAKDYAETDVTDGQAIDTLCGCSMLIPREAFETVGLLDERYFLYLEDADYCLKAAQKGFPSIVALNGTVYHELGATTGRNKPLITYYYQRNRLIFAQTFAEPGAFKRLWGYHRRFRRWRGTIKTILRPSAEGRAHHRAFLLALADFNRGITGPCPHAL